MRKLVAAVAAVLAIPFVSAGSASALPPRPCDAHYYHLLNGEGVSVFCDFGPTDRYRVVAYCESGISGWNDLGNVAPTGYGSSEAECRGLIGTAHVDGIRIDWL